MARMRRIIVEAALIVLGLTPVLQAGNGEGPVLCPPLDEFIAPSLLDFFIYPGFTGN